MPCHICSALYLGRFLFVCFYVSTTPSFFSTVSSQGWLCQGWWALSKTFCSEFGFSLHGLGGAERWMKDPKSASEKPLLTISPQSLQFCHLHTCVQLLSTTWRLMSFITHQHDSRQTRVSLLLKRPTESFTTAWENSLNQFIISKEKARYGWGEEGWSCGTEGKKLASPGPFHYLGRIMPPLLTSVSVNQEYTT